MATYTLPINSLYTESGDDVYAKPLDGNFSGANWPDDSVAAIEVADTNVYEIVLDETKGYVTYLNGHSQSFAANAGTDVITANSHGLLDGATVRFKGADLPAPLVQVTVYFVRDVTTNTFKASATAGGAAIDLTDAGTGTMTFTAPSKRSKAGDTKIGTVPQIRDSELVAEGELDAILDQLDLIQAKTDLIGTGNATVTAPVTLSGTLNTLIIGDDYLSSNGRALVWTVDIPSGTTIAESSCVLRFVRAGGSCTEFELEVTGSIAAATAGKATLTFSITDTQSSTVPAGQYFWFVEWIGDAGEVITIVHNRQLVRWREKAA